MCSTTTGHADARHTSWIPPCLHCGCSCGSKGEYKTGNRVASLRTIGQK
ncbi:MULTISPECIES: Apre_1838 family putative sactipeptide bacteriocin [Anaerococcus]|nr:MULTISPECIES: Apre_1838 family putative sactipeptide bacteriocin [Anaerococcus]